MFQRTLFFKSLVILIIIVVAILGGFSGAMFDVGLGFISSRKYHCGIRVNSKAKVSGRYAVCGSYTGQQKKLAISVEGHT